MRTAILPNLNGDLEEEYFSIIDTGRSIKDIIRESWRCLLIELKLNLKKNEKF